MNNPTQMPKELDEKIVQVNRVSKKTKGGNRIGFAVLTVVGDRKGRVGVGLGKAPTVVNAIRKAVTYAKKRMITVPMKGYTIPHEINVKVGAARIMFKPAPAGTGVIAGGPVRAVVEAAGIRDIVAKILGTNNQASNVYATFEAMRRLRPAKYQPRAKELKATMPATPGPITPPTKPAVVEEKPAAEISKVKESAGKSVKANVKTSKKGAKK